MTTPKLSEGEFASWEDWFDFIHEYEEEDRNFENRRLMQDALQDDEADR
jgi:hypothetical protein